MLRVLVMRAAMTMAAVAAANAVPLPGITDGETLSERHLSDIMAKCLMPHVARNELTPELAAATLSNYVEMLDYGKVYLLQPDVDDAYASRLKFPQAYENGTWQFVTGVYARFLQRVEEQTSNVVALLDSPRFNLDTNRAIVVDPKKTGYPATAAEARARIEDQLQYQVAYLVSIGEPLTGAVVKVKQRRLRSSKQFHEFTQQDRLGFFLNAFCRALDPHTSYMSFEDAEDFQINMALALEGIGALLGSEEGVTVINGLTPGGPAEKSSLVKPGDKILAVAQGKDGAFDDIYDMDLRDVVKKIRGKKGTVVRLKIVRTTVKGTESSTVVLTREKVKLEDQAARMEYVLVARTNAPGSVRHYRVAVIELPSFYADPGAKPFFGGKSTRSAVSDVRRLLRACQTSAVDGVVVDLQRNGGGLLDEAVDVAGLFIRRGNVVVSRDRFSVGRIYEDEDAAVEYSGPLVLTVSRATASGAEIVAGALQDYRRALIIGGDHTFGKGTIQQIMPLPGKLGMLRITVGEYFIASGRSTQNEGVRSDIVVPSELAAFDIGERYEPNALPARSVSNILSSTQRIGAGGSGWEPVTTSIVTHVAGSSQARVKESAEFKKVSESVRKIKEDRAKERVVIASLLQNASTNKQGNGSAATSPEKDADDVVAPSGLTRPPITNDVVILEAVQILTDWVAEHSTAPPAATNAPLAAQASPAPSLDSNRQRK